jgi:peptide/nickel transport system ATP-binding protein
MMADAGHLLEVEDLAVEFDTAGGVVQAVNGIGYHLDAGEVLAILGESGSGKSVQAAAIMNLIDTPPGHITAGRVRYRGQDLLTMPAEARRRINGAKIAMIFQDPLAHLNPVYSVGWQIAETLRAHGAASATEARARALALLERVGIPDPARRADDYPHQFSGGQRQRVMIAMALALRPDVLIADEPTTALDVTVQAQILALLEELQAETGMGLILITHDLGVVAETADRVAVMHAGRIVESGPVRAIFNAPADPYTRRLIAAIPGRAAPAGQGSAVREPNGASPLPGVAPLLSVRGLAKHYPVTTGMMRRATGEVVRAVDGVSFDLAAGETLGVVGESGSGKSTLARTLLRLEEPTAGEARYQGRDLFALTPAELLAFRRRMQIVFQDPYASLNPRMTVAQLIAEPWTIHKDVLPKARWPAKVGELLEQVGLQPEHARRYPHQFSGGQRQRIAIARALALQPEMIICDEAVSALDVSIQAQVIALLSELQRTFGLAYLFIAHDLAVVRNFADRVLVMYRGEVVEQGPCAQIFERPQHPYTQALLAASPLPDPDAQRARRAPLGDIASQPSLAAT